MNDRRSVVVDASVAVKWVLPEEHSREALSFYEDAAASNTEIIAPPHLPVEVANAVWRKVARKLITFDEALQALAVFGRFQVTLSYPSQLLEEALRIAQESKRPTVYDTAYMALARLTDCELWTADITLLNALSGKAPYVKSIASYTPS